MSDDIAEYFWVKTRLIKTRCASAVSFSRENFAAILVESSSKRRVTGARCNYSLCPTVNRTLLKSRQSTTEEYPENACLCKAQSCGTEFQETNFANGKNVGSLRKSVVKALGTSATDQRSFRSEENYRIRRETTMQRDVRNVQ